MSVACAIGTNTSTHIRANTTTYYYQLVLCISYNLCVVLHIVGIKISIYTERESDNRYYRLHVACKNDKNLYSVLNNQ